MRRMLSSLAGASKIHTVHSNTPPVEGDNLKEHGMEWLWSCPLWLLIRWYLNPPSFMHVLGKSSNATQQISG